MKNIFLTCLVAAAVGVSAFNLAEPTGPEAPKLAHPAVADVMQNFKVVPAESNITWIGRKVGGEHTGSVTLEGGTILIERSDLRGGTFLMDMRTITCKDLTDANSNARLVKHLKSDDFFSVEKNRTAMFAITNLAPRQTAKANTANYIVTGDLTIKGITNQISFPMYVKVRKGVATAKGTLKFDRTKWDIKYRSGNFFENLGDKAILDDIELQIDIVAKEETLAKK